MQGAGGQAIANLCSVCTQHCVQGSAELEPVQASLAELLCALSRAPWPVRADDAQDYVILLDAMAQLLSTVWPLILPRIGLCHGPWTYESYPSVFHRACVAT